MNAAIPSLPRPRSYVQTAIQIAIPAMAASAVVWTVQTAWMTDRAFFEQVLPYGLLACFHFGLFGGLITAWFIRGESVTLEFADSSEFGVQLDRALSHLRYYPATTGDHVLVYRPSWRGGIAAGRITVRLHEECATVIGPRYYVRKLERRIDTEDQDGLAP